MFPVLMIRMVHQHLSVHCDGSGIPVSSCTCQAGWYQGPFNFCKKGNKGGYITIASKGIWKATYILHTLPERKLSSHQDQNHGTFFFRDGKWELPGFSRVGQTACQNFPINSLLEKELKKQADQQDNSAVLTSVQIWQMTDN